MSFDFSILAVDSFENIIRNTPKAKRISVARNLKMFADVLTVHMGHEQAVKVVADLKIPAAE